MCAYPDPGRGERAERALGRARGYIVEVGLVDEHGTRYEDGISRVRFLSDGAGMDQVESIHLTDFQAMFRWIPSEGQRVTSPSGTFEEVKEVREGMVFVTTKWGEVPVVGVPLETFLTAYARRS